jgi:hypothetical protein
MSCTKHRRVTAYPSPYNFKKLKEVTNERKISTSKIVNEALTAYFKDKKII